jgi:hypothetical protein
MLGSFCRKAVRITNASRQHRHVLTLGSTNNVLEFRKFKSNDTLVQVSMWDFGIALSYFA